MKNGQGRNDPFKDACWNIIQSNLHHIFSKYITVTGATMTNSVAAIFFLFASFDAQLTWRLLREQSQIMLHDRARQMTSVTARTPLFVFIQMYFYTDITDKGMWRNKAKK